MRYKVIFALAAAIVLSSCTKGIEKGVDAPLNFCANVPEIVQVKAEAVTSVTDFYAAGYDGSTQWFPKNEVQISGSSKTFDSFRWKWDVTKTFYAYTNNVPGGATATIASTGVTLTYTSLPTAASAQTDVLLGRYEGNGNGTGTASMTFYHPLAQVVFNVGTIDASLTAITKIEIEGVYNAGSTTLNTSTTTASGTPAVANFSWTGTGGSVTVSQNVSLPASGQIGVPFMLIPQDLASKNVTVKVYATVGGESKTLTATLNTGSFATGKKTVCTLHYSSVTELNCTLVNYLADAEDDIFIPKNIYINSFEDLLDFKSKVESGKNLSGITVYFPAGGNIYPEMAGEYAGINDPGVLDGVTIEGQFCTIRGLEGCFLRGGLFRNISSDNVTIKDLSIEDFTVIGVDAEPIGTFVSNYSGSSALTLSNCDADGMVLNTNQTTCSAGGVIGKCSNDLIISGCGCGYGAMNVYGSGTIVGGVIGECTGDLSLEDCSVEYYTFNTNGNYQAGIVGKVAGPVSIDMERVRVGIDFYSAKPANVPGLFIGVLDNCQEMNIELTNCIADNSFVHDNYPALGSEGRYYFSCDGLIDGIFFSDFHFYAIACNNNTTEYEKATATLSGIQLNNCSGFPPPELPYPEL